MVKYIYKIKEKIINMKSINGSNTENIYKKIIFTQIILIISLALFLGIAGTIINIRYETKKRDQNLQNIAETIAKSPLLDNIDNKSNLYMLTEYLDSLKNTLDNIDVISIVRNDGVRLYHSNHSLINTHYDGTFPQFDGKEYCASNDTGPSGLQRRAYAAVYDENGNYAGFVMAIMLMDNIKTETMQIFLIFLIITLAAIITEIIVSAELSASIKKSLYGYEPNVFSAMYRIRDNILESLNEGILAIDRNGTVQFVNHSAMSMLGCGIENVVGNPLKNICNDTFLSNTLKSGKKEFSICDHTLKNANVLIDSIPICENEEIIGAVAILHNRAEYTKLMEDLAGTRYLVDSMRANNHDFTNKLHVILGLIQMEMYNEAIKYIENITIMQKASISKIMSAVDEPAIAALLIGKNARASELNIQFVFKEGSRYSKADLSLSSEMLVTIIGNLIDNAFDAMNMPGVTYNEQKKLQFGIYSKTGELLITVSDTGIGIQSENTERIFENGFSTKGDGRGTGLYQVKKMVEENGGQITFQSQIGVGTTFLVSFFENKKGVV